MEEQTNKRLANIFLGAIIFIAILYFAYGFFVAKESSQEKPTPTITLVDYIQYKGKTGKNALELLKEQAAVDLATSGLITSINGRSADNTKQEYWAFYINGKLAQVGPADYQTKDEDMIEWKINKY